MGRADGLYAFPLKPGCQHPHLAQLHSIAQDEVSWVGDAGVRSEGSGSGVTS